MIAFLTRTHFRRRWQLLLVLVLTVGIFLAATARLFIWPSVDQPSNEDAVIVLAGGHSERIALAVRLVEAGVAPTLVHVGEPSELQARELCAAPDPRFEVVCVRPHPDSTRTEARAAARLASERHWRNVVLVTSDYHVTRSRMYFDRCFAGNVKVVAADSGTSIPSLVPLVTTEWLGLLRALTVARDC